MAEYALIAKGEVSQVIVADDAVAKTYPSAVRVPLEQGIKVGPGHLYGVDQKFTMPFGKEVPDPILKKALADRVAALAAAAVKGKG